MAECRGFIHECSARVNPFSSAGSDSNQVPQLSYGSTSPSLSDKNKYKYFYRTCASDVHQASALAALFKKYRWPEVGTVTTDDLYGSGLMAEFSKKVTKMHEVPVSVVSKQQIPDEARAATVRPKIQKVRGFFFSFWEVMRKQAGNI